MPFRMKISCYVAFDTALLESHGIPRNRIYSHLDYILRRRIRKVAHNERAHDNPCVSNVGTPAASPLMTHAVGTARRVSDSPMVRSARHYRKPAEHLVCVTDHATADAALTASADPPIPACFQVTPLKNQSFSMSRLFFAMRCAHPKKA